MQSQIQKRCSYVTLHIAYLHTNDFILWFHLRQLEECRRIVSTEGVGVLSRVDGCGHTPAHWVSLAGAVDIVQLFLEVGGPVDLPSVGQQAQRPVHWATVKGHITVVDLLLRAGVSMDTADRRGYTPLILAAQYGHTALCCYLIGKGAQLNLCDAEGDNALHWAAFKGKIYPFSLHTYRDTPYPKAFRVEPELEYGAWQMLCHWLSH